MASRSFVADAPEVEVESKRFDFSEYFTPKPTSVVRQSGLGATATTSTGSTITYVTMTAAVVGAVVAGGVGVGVGWWLHKRGRR